MPIEWFVTTASQSRIWLKLLSDDSNKVGICLLCRSTQLHATASCRSQFATTCDSSYVLQSSTPYWKSTALYYSVLQSTNPVLLCTTKYYSSTTLYYQVILCTTQYYSSTTLYCAVLLRCYSVLLCTTKYYSSTTLCYKVLLQYYSVLRSTTPVLPCTTQYYSSTALYYTVLLRYYSVLQSTNPVLLCTTKYHSVVHSTTPVLLCTTQCYSSTTQYYSSTTQCYSSTTLYYKVLLQYYSVLQSITKYYSSTTLYYKVLIQYCTPVLLCTTKYYSSTTPVLQSTTPVLVCTTKYYSGTSLFYKVPSHMKPYPALPRKMTLMTNPLHTWNGMDNARSNKCHCPNSPNTAPATQNDCHDWSSSHMKRYLQCAEQQVASSNITKYCACHAKWLSWLILVTYETLFTMRGTTGRILQHHQMLRLPRKMTVMTDPRHIWNAIYNARNNRWHPPTSPNTAPATQNDSPKFQKNFSKTDETSITMRDRSELDPSWIRPWSENETVTPQPASQPRLLFTPTTGILYWKIQHFALRLSFQISPNTAPATKSDTSTSPNTAPATQNDSHDQSATHLKRYLQCAEQQVASSNITKYCACHANWLWKLSQECLENCWNVISNAGPIRAGSDHDPRMKPSLRNPPRNRGYFSRPPQAFCIEKYNISRSGYHSKFHQILRLPTSPNSDTNLISYESLLKRI